jgi:hypothetical protein
MKWVFAALLFVSASAVKYGALQDVLARSPVHTIRLSEIEAQIQSSSPMDSVGQLCFQQLREIAVEVDELDTKHHQFRSMCSSTIAIYNANINRLAKTIANHLSNAAKYNMKWNRLMPILPRITPYTQRTHKAIANIKRHEVKMQERRKQQAHIYQRDVIDFTNALKDVDMLMKILENSINGQTSANIAKTGFLEETKGKFISGIDQVESDALRQMTHRLTLGADFLEEVSDDDQPSGVDKLKNLLIGIRNEMYEEMDKLAEIEAQRIKAHEQYLRRNALTIWRYWHRLGRYITTRHAPTIDKIEQNMRKEAEHLKKSAERRKESDRIVVEKDFLEDECLVEPPLYHKQRENKISEIKTIEAMIKILRNLNWKGAVYNAISRISVASVDENPEPGFTFKFEMDLYDGLSVNQYRYESAEKPENFKRVAIKMTVGSSWVWVSFDAFDPDYKRYLVPSSQNAIVTQQYVTNMVIKKSASARVGTGSSAKGNLEIWRDAYHPRNGYKIPGASDGAYDFGDVRKPLDTNKYGCFQVHDYMRKQTVFAFNNFAKKGKHDVGIGSQRSTAVADQPDWTHKNNIQEYKDRKEPVTVEWYFQSKSFQPKVVTNSPTPKAPAPAPTKKPATAPAPAPAAGLLEDLEGI